MCQSASGPFRTGAAGLSGAAQGGVAAGLSGAAQGGVEEGRRMD
jgi:hypothetical protein